jgi:hypothetical protein
MDSHQLTTRPNAVGEKSGQSVHAQSRRRRCSTRASLCRRRVGRCGPPGQGLAESGLLGLIERRPHHRPADPPEVGEDLVRRHLSDQQEQARRTGLQCASRFLHEIVVDADIGQAASERARGGAERGAEQRVEEDQADQGAPERPGTAAGTRTRLRRRRSWRTPPQSRRPCRAPRSETPRRRADRSANSARDWS